MRKFNIKVDGKNYQVEVEEVGGAVQTQTISAPVQTSAPAPVAPVAVGDGEKLESPMPGTILNFLVADGETVKKGQDILVLEAMKMENPIAAPADGKVTFSVSKGASVNSGDVLAVIS